MKNNTKKFLLSIKDLYKNQEIFIIGKGPSLQKHYPFTEFENKFCIGINNVYKYFPFCSIIVMWHKEFYFDDEKYIISQKKFDFIYSDFHGLNSKVGINLPYADEFVLDDVKLNSYFDMDNEKWMYKATPLTALKIAIYMGAKEINLVGFDFSGIKGETVNNNSLYVPVPLRKYTTEQIHSKQKESIIKIIDYLKKKNNIKIKIF